jgi:hypothetical protein
MKWNFVGSTFNDSFILNGIDVFQEKWISTGKSVQVKDPIYGETKNFGMFLVNVNHTEFSFVAGEFSNNVWGFYTLD